jgi:hypothetical protein
MAYRNKTFVSFASQDLHYYRLMCAWRENEKIDFHFLDAHDINVARDTSSQDTINRRLSERLSNTKQVVMLAGDVTRVKAARTTSFIYHEVRTIVRLNIPLVFANLNKSRKVQHDKIPAALIDRYSISVPFGPQIIKYALDDFPEKYVENLRRTPTDQKKGPYEYVDSIYTRLGI